MKKGVSPLLAAVLLVALAVTMAAIVSQFLIKKTQEFNPDQLAQQSLYCDSVSLGYSVPDATKLGIYTDGSIDPTTDKIIRGSGLYFFSPITLINRGNFAIQKFIINAPGMASAPALVYEIDASGHFIPISLMPGLNNKYNITIQINPNNIIKDIKIIPIIKDPEKNQLVICTDRQLVINYQQICQDITPSFPNCKNK